MIDFKKIIVLLGVCCVQIGIAQDKAPTECKEKIVSYLDAMEQVATPKNDEVYHMRYTTKTVFFESYDIPTTATETDMLISNNQIAMNDENMKVYGDDKNMFVVLPKVGKIYWNDSDPKLFTDNNSYKKFLDIERKLLNSSTTITCTTGVSSIDTILIIPTKEFEKDTGLIKQMLKYDRNQHRVISVVNSFNTKSKIKKQQVNYEILDYNSAKKIKEPLKYIFKGTNLMSLYKDFEIIDNRTNKK